MHQSDVCHRDLKLDNVFVFLDGALVKIGDFGLARKKSSQKKTLKLNANSEIDDNYNIKNQELDTCIDVYLNTKILNQSNKKQARNSLFHSNKSSESNLSQSGREPKRVKNTVIERSQSVDFFIQGDLSQNHPAPPLMRDSITEKNQKLLFDFEESKTIDRDQF